MILSQPEIRAAVDRGEIKFDPPLEERQWGEASVDLRLGLNFTKLKKAPGVTISMARGIGSIAETGLWQEKTLKLQDQFGKKETCVLDPDEFLLALTHERVWIPRNLIAMVEVDPGFGTSGLIGAW